MREMGYAPDCLIKFAAVLGPLAVTLLYRRFSVNACEEKSRDRRLDDISTEYLPAPNLGTEGSTVSAASIVRLLG